MAFDYRHNGESKIGFWIRVVSMIFLAGGAFFLLQADVSETKESVKNHEGRIQALERQDAANKQWQENTTKILERMDRKLDRIR